MPAVPVTARARPSCELLDEPARLLDARLGLGGARLGAAAQPLDLAPHPVGERLLVGRLPAQELVAPREELAVAPVRLEQAVGIDAVQLDHARGHVLEEVAVVADHQARRARARRAALEPEDAFEVEVVGGLVEQQEVGRGGQLAGDGQALLPAAGERVDVRAARRRSRRGRAPGRGGRGGRPRPRRPAPAGDDVGDGDARRKDRVLGDVADAEAAAERARAAVGRARGPARIFSRVDLPEPLGPTRPTWSPSKNPNERSSKSDRVPKALLTASQLNRSGRAIRRYFFFFGFFFSFRMPVPFAMSSPPLGSSRDCSGDYRRAGAAHVQALIISRPVTASSGASRSPRWRRRRPARRDGRSATASWATPIDAASVPDVAGRAAAGAGSPAPSPAAESESAWRARRRSAARQPAVPSP